MIRLLAVELRRLAARRLTKVGVLLFVAGMLVMAVILAVNSTGPSAGDLARADQRAEKQLARCLRGRMIRAEDVAPDQTLEQACLEAGFGNPRNFVYDDRFRLAELVDVLPGLGMVFIVGGLMLGASSIGAEWHAGTVTTQLTWEPRRVRMLIGKLVAGAVVVFVLAVLLQVVLVALFGLVASTRGVTEGIDIEWFRRMTGIVLRVAVLASLTGVLGMSLATITRNTAASLGIVLAEAAVFESLIRGFKPEWVRWLVGENSAVFIFGGNEPALDTFGRTPVDSFVVLAAYVAVIAVAGFVMFTRRDVT